MADQLGHLWIVPTPIGNLEDITLRAIRILKEVDLILAEDTRNTGKLLKHLKIQNSLQSYHAFNEHQMLKHLVEKLAQGTSMALVSDAGTPAISDPGFLLVRACIEKNIPVQTLPGPTAFVPALVNSGLPADRFAFEGFLPHKKGRSSRLEKLKGEERTLIFYESPHRLQKTLSQLAELCGEERKASIARELTKHYEENVRGTLPMLIQHFEKNPAKGEIVLMVEGKNNRKQSTKEKNNA